VKIPFRVAIGTVVVGLLLATGGSLVLYQFSQSRKNVALLERAYLDQVADAAVGEVSRLRLRVDTILLAERALAERGLLTFKDPIALAQSLAQILEGIPDLAWLSYADQASGRFAGATRVRTGQLVINVSDPRRRGGVPEEFQVGDHGRLTPFVRTPALTEAYDPRTRPWYRRAVTSPERIVWMPPYVFAEGVKGVTAAVAVRRGGGTAIDGVVTADLSLRGIDRFVRSVRVADHGAVALYGADGELLAGGPGPTLEAIAQVMRLPSARAKKTHVRGVTYDVILQPVSVGESLEWVIGVSVPEEDFTGVVNTNLRMAMVISGVGLLAALLAGVVLSSGIARSLGRVVGELDRIAAFQLTGGTTGGSVLREIAHLQNAVARVLASLRSFARYAPEEIVREVVISGREAMLSGERREVTALFCDLRGFTRFAEEVGPEQVVAILNDHFDVLSALLAARGGYIVDFLGDGLFAVFGAPERCDNHAAQAVACAIEMQQAREARNREYFARGWPPLEMGIGINTGIGVVGNMGSNLRIKYGVVGHPVNLAARIETFTVGGQVLVSDSTRDALAGRLVAEGPLEAEGKGVSGTMHMWAVRRLDGDIPLALPSPDSDLTRLETPLEAGVRVIRGKQIGAETYPARLLRLGASGVELRTAAPLALFDAAQVILSAQIGFAAALDGKTVSVTDDAAGGRTALVRFGGLGWKTRERLEALARGGTTPAD